MQLPFLQIISIEVGKAVMYRIKNMFKKLNIYLYQFKCFKVVLDLIKLGRTELPLLCIAYIILNKQML